MLRACAVNIGSGHAVLLIAAVFMGGQILRCRRTCTPPPARCGILTPAPGRRRMLQERPALPLRQAAGVCTMAQAGAGLSHRATAQAAARLACCTGGGGPGVALSTGPRGAGSPCAAVQAIGRQTLTAGQAASTPQQKPVRQRRSGSALSDGTCRCRPQARLRAPALPGALPAPARRGELLRYPVRCLHGLTAWRQHPCHDGLPAFRAAGGQVRASVVFVMALM